jgi:DNA-directed RNA polymerase I, II, and III subunit RPABC2
MNLVDDYVHIRESLAKPGAANAKPQSSVMTKYEFNQIIGLRTMHLSKGAPPMVDVPKDFVIKSNTELRALAVRELADGRLPNIVKRTMPNGKIEYWRVGDLDLCAVRHLMRG